MTSSSSSFDKKVVIVGAGLAGLSCAAKLLSTSSSSLVAPSDVVIVEALDRPGGRTLTSLLPDTDEPVDVGACWVCPRQKNVHRLLREHDLDVIEQQTSGVRVGVRSAGGLFGWISRALGRETAPTEPLFTTLRGLPVLDLVQYSLLTRRVNRMAMTIPIGRPWDAKGAEKLDSSSVMAWLEEEGAPNNSTARGLMAATAQSVFCADASQISMLLFLTVVAEEGGVEVLLEEAQTQRVVQGNGTLSRRLAASLAERGVEIRLGAEVVECSHSAKDGATVATRDGARFRARRVVLAVPPPALAGLSLEPKLAGPLGAEVAASAMGKVIKVVVEFAARWWEGAHCAMADPEVLTTTLAFDVSPLHASPPRHVLAIFFFGAKAEHWSATKTPEERREEAVRCARLMFGEAADQAPCEVVASVEGDWPAVPFIRGGYMSYPALSSITQTQSYSSSVPQSCLHFASTENASAWRGYMDGAIQSGERAAAEVAEALRTTT